MLRLALIAGLAGVLSTAAMAQPTGAGATPEPTATAAASTDATASNDSSDPNKVICRNVRPPTGTRVSSARSRQRICQTREEWDNQAREAQEALKVRDKGTCSNGACAG